MPRDVEGSERSLGDPEEDRHGSIGPLDAPGKNPVANISRNTCDPTYPH
jgi:hypothetical protein